MQCANDKLTQVLRGTFGFNGYVTSDTGAIGAIAGAHRMYNHSAAAAVAAALTAGCDINSGNQYTRNIVHAVQSGLLKEAVVDAALINAFTVRIRLGLFDPAYDQPKFIPEQVNSLTYQKLSLDASRQAMTLLSNRATVSRLSGGGESRSASASSSNGGRKVLPLSRGSRLAVIGPLSDTKSLMVGGTGAVMDSAQIVCKGAKDHDDWSCVESPYEAIAAINGAATLTTLSTGASIHPENEQNSTLSQMMTQAVAAAQSADAVGPSTPSSIA